MELDVAGGSCQDSRWLPLAVGGPLVLEWARGLPQLQLLRGRSAIVLLAAWLLQALDGLASVSSLW